MLYRKWWSNRNQAGSLHDTWNLRLSTEGFAGDGRKWSLFDTNDKSLTTITACIWHIHVSALCWKCVVILIELKFIPELHRRICHHCLSPSQSAVHPRRIVGEVLCCLPFWTSRPNHVTIESRELASLAAYHYQTR